MAFDLERIGIILSDLEKYFIDLDQMKIKNAADLQEKSRFYASSMIIFSIINRTFNLGEEIVEAKTWGSVNI